MSTLVLLVPVVLVLPWIGVLYWLIFRCPEMPEAQTRPLPVMAYEEPQQQTLLERAFLYLRDKYTSIRQSRFPT